MYGYFGLLEMLPPDAGVALPAAFSVIGGGGLLRVVPTPY